MNNRRDYLKYLGFQLGYHQTPSTMQKGTETLKLTVSEAIAEGYELCSDRTDEFTLLHRVDELREGDFDDETWFLAEKEPYYKPFTTQSEVADTLADIIAAKNHDETGDDTDDVYDIVNGLDFTAAVEMINKALQDKKYYKLTKIQLIPDAKGNNTADSNSRGLNSRY